MELFVIKNNSGEVVSKGFKSKMEAKQVRKELHSEAGIVEKEITNWKTGSKFRVSKGSDHIKYKGRRHKNANKK